MAELREHLERLVQERLNKPATRSLLASGGLSPPQNPDEAEATTPRRYCPTCDGAGFVYRTVPFGHELFGRATNCPACNGPDPESNRETLWRLSGVAPYERYACTFQSFRPGVNPHMHAAEAAADEWSDGDGMPFLTLASPDKGVGKTHLAIAAAGRCIQREVATLYAVAPLWLSTLRDTQRPDHVGPSLEDVRRRAERYPVLVLDDFGAGRGTDWADEQLFLVINERYRNRLRTLVTTNVLPERIEGRIYSRLVDWQLSRVVVCGGQDYRLRGVVNLAPPEVSR